MPHRYELTRPAVRILASLARGVQPDPEDVRVLRGFESLYGKDLSIEELARRVVESEKGKRSRRGKE